MDNTFSTTKRNNVYDEFWTPNIVINRVFEFLFAHPFLGTILRRTKKALEPGANTGRWGKSFKQIREREGITVPLTLVGSEILNMPKPEVYDEWYVEDFLQSDHRNFDLVFGNPPYSMRKGTRKTVIYDFIHRSMFSLKHGGMLVFLVRSGLQHNSQQYVPGGIFYDYTLFGVYPLVPRPNFASEDSRFNGGGARHNSDIFVFTKGYRAVPEMRPIIWKGYRDNEYRKYLSRLVTY